MSAPSSAPVRPWRVAGAAVLLLLACVPLSRVPAFRAEAPGVAEDRREVVFVVHGMGRSRLSMGAVAESLERDGYRVVNWGYSSTSMSVPELGDSLAARVARDAGHAPKVHFVGHSLGNIVARWAVAYHRPPNLGRMVMLAPPNQGSRAADRYSNAIGWYLRPIGELRTADGSTVRALPGVSGVDVGIVAGKYDDKVSVDETRLDGARETVVVPATHSFLMYRRDVQRLTRRFLRDGRFAG